MKTMTTWQQAADEFLEFFEANGHALVPSSSLVVIDDPTLLFVNSGMVQFKDTFLGLERRQYNRAATLQKCMRVQGKHNDLETVGPSPRHHTFFFMLGNFSFGDYFKEDAIPYAWELVTRRYSVDPDRLVITVYLDDDESDTAWRKMGVPPSRILRLDERTNFWMMAEVGPCGPNSEIHYDWGPEHCTCGRSDCSVALDNGCLRWLEIWNLVFMQFDQRADGTRVRLPKPGVDTGMGLERMTSVLQGVNDDYRTDLFVPIMDRVQSLVGQSNTAREGHTVTYRVVADHARAMTFLMGDGIVPGNEGRGYVLRMVMRRAMRFARSVGLTEPFLGEIAGVVIDQMSNRYPDLQRKRNFITQAAHAEEERFDQTLSNGLEQLKELIQNVRARGQHTIPGEEIFRLYDTFGFPVEMTRDIAREHGMDVDEEGFSTAMAAQRERARGAQIFEKPTAELRFIPLTEEGIATEFIGYRKQRARAKVLALFVDGRRVDETTAGTDVEVVLDRTPFYAEAGGQVGDTGDLRGSRVEVEVLDTQRPAGSIIVHRGQVREGRLRVGMPITAEIDAARRADIMRNHTATHLLHRALQEVLGEHARQAGSLVAPERLRFDFIHLAPLSGEQRKAIEQRVNERVLADLSVRAKWMSFEEATKLGAMALFGEKYGDRVRVISINGYSRELCGGTHLGRTGEIGLFKITSEGGVAAGVRRIEAVTGRGALEYVSKQESIVRSLSERLKSLPDELLTRVERSEEQVKELQKRLEIERALANARQIKDIRAHAVLLADGTSVIAERVHVPDIGYLRSHADQIKREFDLEHEPAIVVLGSDSTGQVIVSSNTTIHAGKFVEALTSEFGGSGGGRANFGQGGLKEPTRIDELIHKSRDARFLETVVAKARISE